MGEELRDVRVRLEQLERRCERAERRARVRGFLSLAVVVAAVLMSPAVRPALAQSGVTLKQLLSRVIALEDKTQYLCVWGGEMYVNGANLRIVNGMGSTETTNGKGNLIVGYNEPRGAGDARTGSHNIVVGSNHNYTSYGGLVAGLSNTISGPYASVSGGGNNTASQWYSSVSGGFYNEASGRFSSISGGSGITINALCDWAAGSGGATTYSGNFRSP